MILQRLGEADQERRQPGPIDFRELRIGGDLQAQIPRVVHELAPQLAGLPPAGVGRVIAEPQQDAEDDARKDRCFET